MPPQEQRSADMGADVDTDTDTDTPNVRAVVLNYNGGSLVVDAVTSLFALEWAADRLEVVLVDNASSDGSADLAAERFPDLRVIRSPTNLGFPGNNLAMGDLRGVDHVLLLNPDATVAPDLLRRLVERAGGDDPDGGGERLGAVCPKILLRPRFAKVRVRGTDGRDRLWIDRVEVDDADVTTESLVSGDPWPLDTDRRAVRYGPTDHEVTLHVPLPDGRRPVDVAVRLDVGAVGPSPVIVDGGGPCVAVAPDGRNHRQALSLGGGAVDIVNNVGSCVWTDGSGGDRGFLEPDVGQYDAPSAVFAWCGACVLLSRPYLEDVGLLAESFFLYYEDTDLSWRGQARGWAYAYEPSAVARHVHSAIAVAGSDLFAHHVERNRLAMITRNAPVRLALSAPLAHLLTTASYLRRDVVVPLGRRRRPRPTTVRRRMRSWFAWLVMLPGLVADRRRLRRRQTVSDRDLVARLTAR
jgi:GT2 family glycosyltransferase